MCSEKERFYLRGLRGSGSLSDGQADSRKQSVRYGEFERGNMMNIFEMIFTLAISLGSSSVGCEYLSSEGHLISRWLEYHEPRRKGDL